MSDHISRTELFNRLATITAENANDMKAKIYAVIQEMETEPPFAHIEIDPETVIAKLKDEGLTVDIEHGASSLTGTTKAAGQRPEHHLRCSRCGKHRVIAMGQAFPNYCENCGAKMARQTL